jgi:hypothetical protein
MIHFNIRIIRKGDAYGLNDCLTHEDADPMVEFYDPRHSNTKNNPIGQFVSRYYLKTLLDGEDRLSTHGLDLQGGVPDWKLSPSQMREIIETLKGVKYMPEDQSKTNAERIKEMVKLHDEIHSTLFLVNPKLSYREVIDKIVELSNMCLHYQGDNDDWLYIGQDDCVSVSDLIPAAYWHLTEWHNGKDLYDALCQLGKMFNPGMSAGPEDETSEKDAYEELGRMAENERN